MQYPKHLQQLIETLKRLPGVGKKSAERFAFQMLDWKSEYHFEMAELIKNISTSLKSCQECGSIRGDEACRVCSDFRKKAGVLCIVASSKDVYAIEATHTFKGIYQVLGSLLSPLDGKGPEHLPLQKIKDRISHYAINEVIIALDSTLEGDATALYLRKELGSLGVEISRLALGMPMGSSLDYVDEGTLARALQGRQVLG